MCRWLCRLHLVKGSGGEQTGRQRSVVEVHRGLHHEPERKNTVKSLAVLLLVAFCIAAALTPQGVRAAPLGIPAAVYPAGAHISYRPVLTNAEMDCLWGFFCEGNLPLFHFATQDQLHRVGGWGQFAGVQHRGRMTTAFELFVSRYDPVPDDTGIPWGERAFLDLKAAIRAQGYYLVPHGTDLLPAAPATGALLAVQHLGKQDLVVMASWSGTLEIEGIALYDHRPAARQSAWASLARQIHLASTRGA